MDSPKAQYSTTFALTNKKAPSLESGDSDKYFGMFNLKHETSSPKSYELLIKTKLK